MSQLSTPPQVPMDVGTIIHDVPPLSRATTLAELFIDIDINWDLPLGDLPLEDLPLANSWPSLQMQVDRKVCQYLCRSPVEVEAKCAFVPSSSFAQTERLNRGENWS